MILLREWIKCVTSTEFPLLDLVNVEDVTNNDLDPNRDLTDGHEDFPVVQSPR